MPFTRLTRGALIGLLGLLTLCALASHAHAQIKPYFLVVVDTSGSMSWCAPGASDCSCHAMNDCSKGFNKNRCGFDANKLGDAKCALQRIIDSTGDATFGLMQFAHACDSGNTCANTTTGWCDAQLLVPIQNSNQSLMREWVDGNCNGASNGVPPGAATCASTGFLHELTNGSGTPIAQSLRRAQEYLRGTEVLDNMGRWMGNDIDANSGAGAALSTGVWITNTTNALPPASPLKNDTKLACRPVSVILLTDGVDTCEPSTNNARSNNPPKVAKELFTGSVTSASLATKAFRTYVIGFGSSSDYDPTVLDNIADMGGTDAKATGGHK
ncbi:MAG TPA: hypothetical protein VHM19_14365, partial [Polyangiales bacterium]|nr:hypothetical protein [Polyangiales bacterium]